MRRWRKPDKRMDDKGREMEIVRLGPGDFFGEAVALAGVLQLYWSWKI